LEKVKLALWTSCCWVSNFSYD